MRTRLAVLAAVIGTTMLSLSVAQAATGVPRPLAGKYKILQASSDATAGSLMISNGRTTMRALKFKPDSFGCSSTAWIHVDGTFRLHNVADDKNGATDNSPDWSIAKTDGGTVQVTAHQGTETFTGQLSMGFGSKNGTRTPVKFATGEFDGGGCSVLLGASHRK